MQHTAINVHDLTHFPDTVSQATNKTSVAHVNANELASYSCIHVSCMGNIHAIHDRIINVVYIGPDKP